MLVTGLQAPWRISDVTCWWWWWWWFGVSDHARLACMNNWYRVTDSPVYAVDVLSRAWRFRSRQISHAWPPVTVQPPAPRQCWHFSSHPVWNERPRFRITPSKWTDFVITFGKRIPELNWHSDFLLFTACVKIAFSAYDTTGWAWGRASGL